METQQASAHISALSRMNAFYGIPNLSQETTAAVEQGLPAPEVYTPEKNQPAPAPEDTSAENAAESFFTEATEQVEISDQAQALQQQAQQALAEPAAAGNAAGEETQPESPMESPAAEQLNSPNAGAAPTNGPNKAPAAASALNAEAPPSAPENNAAALPPEGAYAAEQPGPLNQPAAGPGANPNAGQPGALFSALG